MRLATVRRRRPTQRLRSVDDAARGRRRLRSDGIREDRRRRGSRRPSRDGGGLGGRDAGLPRPPHPHQPARAGDAFGRGLRPGRGDERRVVRGARASRDRCARRRARGRSRVGRDGPLPPRCARRPRRPACSCTRGSREDRGRGGRGSQRGARPAGGARPGRGDRRAPARPQAPDPGARARRDGHLARRGAGPPLVDGDTPSHRGPGSAGRCRGARAAHPRADRGDVHPRRCRRGAVGPHSRRVPTAAKTLGLDEIARLGPDALEPIVARTRRYAAYQRKWMRRIPGVVLVDGNRPPDVVAEEILTRTDG